MNMNVMNLLVIFWVFMFLYVCLESIKDIYIEGSFVVLIYLKFLFYCDKIRYKEKFALLFYLQWHVYILVMLNAISVYTFCIYVHSCKYMVCNDTVCVYYIPIPIVG